MARTKPPQIEAVVTVGTRIKETYRFDDTPLGRFQRDRIVAWYESDPVATIVGRDVIDVRSEIYIHAGWPEARAARVVALDWPA